jgi:hypothetical protein
MKKYPFKFLDSYGREDRSVFFGRDEEINTLYEMVFQSAVVLVYGASGTGKTSLINCGLASKFEPHDWLPLMIRRGANLNESFDKALKEAGGIFSVDFEDQNWSDDLYEENSAPRKTLSPIEKTIRAVYQNSFRPIYLIFDQFEELFILGTKAEQALFIATIKEVLQSEEPVKLIFSIREEYLGHLDEFERAIPQLLQKKLRVEPMNLHKVKQVILGAAEFEDSNISIKTGESDWVAEGIFEKIKGSKKSLTIQLPFLQVFLDKFYLKITGDKSRKSEAEFNAQSLREMGEIGDILIDFLEEMVSEISRELKEKHPQLSQEVTWKILSPFSTLEGTKEPISKQELYNRLPDLPTGMIDAVIDAFLNNRMLRYNETSDTFEIAHDALAKPIAEKRSVEDKALLEIRRLITSQVAVKKEAREYFTEKQLLFIEPYLEKFKPGAEEKDWISKSQIFIKGQKELQLKKQIQEQNQKRRERRKWLVLVASLIIFSLGFIVLRSIKAQEEKIDLLNKNLDAQIEKDKTHDLLELVMQGRGEKYENLSDSTLLQILFQEQNYPIEELIEIKASVSPSNAGGRNKNYTMWIDLPSFRKDEIEEVQYHFCRGFVDRVRISKDPTSSFSIGYLGWGYCPTMEITVVLKTGKSLPFRFSFEEYFRKNPLARE